MKRYEIGSVDELGDGESMVVELNGIDVAVFKLDGEIFAIQNVCPHKEGPLYKSEVSKEERAVYCPWHYWEFDIETGENPVNDSMRLRQFEAGIDDSQIWVKV